MEAIELEMKAAAARQAAEEAAREEIEAAREEIALEMEGGGMELMALEAVPPETPIRRYLAHLFCNATC